MYPTILLIHRYINYNPILSFYFNLTKYCLVVNPIQYLVFSLCIRRYYCKLGYDFLLFYLYVVNPFPLLQYLKVTILKSVAGMAR